jgi:1-acyl-sn-glycerol-3-phosphate acyltransferase
MKPILTEPMRGTGFAALLGKSVLRLLGWSWHCPANLPAKCVIMVYPHTSNWDFPIGLAFKWASGMQVNYLGKESLFKSPLGWFFRATGGIPVDRSQPRGMVGTMIDALRSDAGIVRFVIPAEGTRTYTPTLKTGFYRSAIEAKVPLVLSTIDFKGKFVGVFDSIMLSGDESADLARLAQLYEGMEGLKPANMAPFTFPPKK